MWAMILSLLFVSVSASAVNKLYSTHGGEHVVEFEAEFHTQMPVERFANLQEWERRWFREYSLEPTLRYLFGPGSYRKIGNPLTNHQVTVHWNSFRNVNGQAVVKYSYSGHWVINERMIHSQFEIPVPLNENVLRSERWTKCSDSNPDNHDFNMFWYYWDPSRYNCDHELGKTYQMVTARLRNKTMETTQSYPEYDRMLEDGVLSMTFAFGYAKELHNPNPETDRDVGVAEYRHFRNFVRSAYQLQETPITQRDYGMSSDLRVGSLFTGSRNGHRVEIRVVINAGVDQMALFAKSFANLHDDFFGWLGHSRLGQGFDSGIFRQILMRNRSTYSVSDKFQLVYWGGCNSYSYYTAPFFQIKHELSPMSDPLGYRNLDIIANGFASYFHLNSKNSIVLLGAFMNTPQKRSYQDIVDQLTRTSWATILPMVIGDEDNSQQ